MANKSWIQLFPDTFLWIKANKGLLYNARNKKSYAFHPDKQIKSWCSQLLDPDNLYCTLADLDIGQKQLEWIGAIEKMGFGRIIAEENSEHRPVSLPPILYMEKKLNTDSSDANENLLTYLHEIVFYVGGNETEHPDYYKQLYYPVYAEQCLSAAEMIEYINKSEGYNLHTLSFIGMECLSPDEMKRVIERLSAFQQKKVLVTTIGSLDFHISLIKQNPNAGFRLTIVCNSISEYITGLQKAGPLNRVKYILLVKSDADCMETEAANLPDHVTLYPVYTGNNLQFFEENIFMTENDLRETEWNKREIFRNQTLNSNFFGKLIVMPDKKVYADANNPPLGSVSDSVYESIFKAMTENRAWMKIRNHAPCTTCVYQWMCPPPSNYEAVLEKPNLCCIKDESIHEKTRL